MYLNVMDMAEEAVSNIIHYSEKALLEAVEED